MKKTKTQKGITLVALIITIIVLLILAVVAITSIQNDGIFKHANNAATQFNDAQTNEQTDLNSYETFLNQYGGGSTTVTPDPNEPDGGDDSQLPTVWTQDGTTVQKGTTILTVGDYVEYNSGMSNNVTLDNCGSYFSISAYEDNNGWRILGVENGQILIVSNLLSINESEDSTFLSYDITDLKNLLNESSEKFINPGNSLITGARAITVEDLNRVTKYNATENNYSYTVAPTYLSTTSPAYVMLFNDMSYYTSSYRFTSAYEEEWGGDVVAAYYCSVNSGVVGFDESQTIGNTGWNLPQQLKTRAVVKLDADVTMTRTSASDPWTIGTATAE